MGKKEIGSNLISLSCLIWYYFDVIFIYNDIEPSKISNSKVQPKPTELKLYAKT